MTIAEMDEVLTMAQIMLRMAMVAIKKSAVDWNLPIWLSINEVSNIIGFPFCATMTAPYSCGSW